MAISSVPNDPKPEIPLSNPQLVRVSVLPRFSTFWITILCVATTVAVACTQMMTHESDSSVANSATQKQPNGSRPMPAVAVPAHEQIDDDLRPGFLTLSSDSEMLDTHVESLPKPLQEVITSDVAWQPLKPSDWPESIAEMHKLDLVDSADIPSTKLAKRNVDRIRHVQYEDDIINVSQEPSPAQPIGETENANVLRTLPIQSITSKSEPTTQLVAMQNAAPVTEPAAQQGPELAAPGEIPAPNQNPAVTPIAPKDDNEFIEKPNPQVTDDTQRQILIQAARNSVALGNLEEAATRFESLLEAFPTEIEGRVEYAGILARLGRNIESIQAYRTALQYDPQNVEAISSLADLLVQQEQLQEASELLMRQLQQDPKLVGVALRLVRIFLQTNNRIMAMQTFNQFVRGAILDKADRISAAEILLELNDPAGAIQLLVPLMESDTLGPDGLKLALRCYAVAGVFDSLRNLVNHHVQIDPRNAHVILELAGELLDEERYLAALHMLEETARFAEPNPQILLLLTRARIGEYQLVLAQQTLDEYCDVIPEGERTLLTGEIMLKAGNYLEALSDFDQALAFNPHSHQAAYGKARALQELGQFDIAEAILTDYVQCHPDLLSAKYRLAQLYYDRRNFMLAEGIYLEILSTNPGIVYTYEAYLKLLAESHRYADALALVDKLRATRPQESLLMSAIRIEQAHILIKKGQAIEAMQLLRNFEPASRSQLARGYLMMYQAATVSGDPAVAAGAKVKLLQICSESLGTSIQTASEALDECMPGLAVEILDQARHISGDQIALIVRQADAYAALNNYESFCVAEELYRAVLTMSPTNARARIGLCRVLASQGRFPEAEQCYYDLTCDMPNFVTASRENARLVYSRRGRVHGDAAYNNLLKQAPKHSVTPVVPPKLGPSLSIDPINFDSHGLTEAIAVEQTAKSWKDWRASTAICEYEKLIAIEPSNEDAYFDLGQQYSVKKNTYAAMGAYHRLLEVNPCNYAANIALDGTTRKIVPRTNFDFLYFHQSGRDGLANVTQLGLDWGVVFPFGNEDEYFRFSYTHLIYDAPGYDAVIGSAFGGEYHDRFHDCYTFFAEMDVQIFDEGFSSRPTFDIGLGMDTYCDGYVEIGGFLENVVQNGESIQQDIFMGGGRLFGYCDLMPRWHAESRYRFIGYSDHNFRHDFYVHNRFRLNESPNQLNLLADYDFLSFDETSIFGPGPGIEGTIYPYFSPSGFSNASLGMEWKHHFSQYTFNGAPETWASLEYRGQWDSRGEFYNIASIKAYHDINGCLSTGAEYRLMRSGVYDSDTVYAYLVWYLP
ncbi:tetratricopeptide repeat protein [Bremerella sp.]|uniref:tetratricopeptide repeat protein n=1 Tax=Bremerella sp. TaxID=2795602 RepID=UPI003918C60C